MFFLFITFFFCCCCFFVVWMFLVFHHLYHLFIIDNKNASLCLLKWRRKREKNLFFNTLHKKKTENWLTKLTHITSNKTCIRMYVWSSNKKKQHSLSKHVIQPYTIHAWIQPRRLPLICFMHVLRILKQPMAVRVV